MMVGLCSMINEKGPEDCDRKKDCQDGKSSRRKMSILHEKFLCLDYSIKNFRRSSKDK